jgi:hypothetical protein
MRAGISLQLGINPDQSSPEAGVSEQRTLEDIADEAEAQGPLPLRALQNIALDAAPFRTARPNYAHKALAFLLWEGVVAVFSANWDQCVEFAASELGFPLSVTVTDADRAGRFRDARYHKVHGCASDSGSLMVSTAQIGTPPAWALSEVQAALSGKRVIFLGLGTVGDYVATRIERVLSVVPTGSAQFYVVTPDAKPSAAWAALLPDKAEPNHFAETAAHFLDCLLRQLWFRMVSLAQQRAKILMATTWKSGDLDANLTALNGAFAVTDALSAFIWIRRGSVDVAPGTPVVLGPAGATILLCLSAVIHDASVRAAERHTGIVLETDDFYIEVAIAPGVDSARVVSLETSRVDELAKHGAYEIYQKPVLHVCLDHDGPLPSRQTPGNLVDGDETNLITVGVTHLWVSARSLLDSGEVMVRAA